MWHEHGSISPELYWLHPLGPHYASYSPRAYLCSVLPCLFGVCKNQCGYDYANPHRFPPSHTHVLLVIQLSLMDTVYIYITLPRMLQDLLSKEKTVSLLGWAVQILLYLTLIVGEYWASWPMNWMWLCATPFDTLSSWISGFVVYDVELLDWQSLGWIHADSLYNEFSLLWVTEFQSLFLWDSSGTEAIMCWHKTLMYACCVLILVIPISHICLLHPYPGHCASDELCWGPAQSLCNPFLPYYCGDQFLCGSLLHQRAAPFIPHTKERQNCIRIVHPSSPQRSTHSSIVWEIRHGHSSKESDEERCFLLENQSGRCAQEILEEPRYKHPWCCGQ